MDRVGLRDGRTQELRHEVGGDGADLRVLKGGVAKRAVVDRDLDALGGLALLGQGAGPPDPGDDAAQLLVELKALQAA
jgi:ribosomal protein L10